MAKNKKSPAKKAVSKPAPKKKAPPPAARRVVAVAKKPVSPGKSPAPSAKLPVANAKPPVANAKLPVANAKLPVANAKPPVANAKPPVANAKPPVANAKPPAANGKSPAPNGKSPRSPTMEKPSKKNALRDSILKRKAAAKPIAFSLDEVRAIAQTVTSKTHSPFPQAKAAPVKNSIALEKPIKPQHVKAASLADILGFNPKKSRTPELTSDKDIPEKYKRYFRLLHDLRASLTEGIERHSEETLKRSAKDDAGDLSAYGQHMADAGTDTFDRDFALSMVASEQEALSEIDSALKRIHDGTYGICEITQKPIAKERLLAVPFTRYSAEAQKDIERNRHRSRTQAGLFGELGEEGGKMMDEDSRGDE